MTVYSGESGESGERGERGERVKRRYALSAGREGAKETPELVLRPLSLSSSHRRSAFTPFTALTPLTAFLTYPLSFAYVPIHTADSTMWSFIASSSFAFGGVPRSASRASSA